MMDKNTTLYFHNFSYNGYQDSFLNSLENLSDGSKFFITMSKRFKPSRFVARMGEWSLPWPQELIPKFKMPDYDPSFKLSFEEVTNIEANKIKKRINQGEKFALMYSGGLDSTTVLTSLLRILTKEELNSLIIYTSLHSVLENPSMWYNHIKDKLQVIDSVKVKCDTLLHEGLIPITADEGDPIFGTMIGLGLYQNFDAIIDTFSPETKLNLKSKKSQLITGDLHFSVFKDLIIKHLSFNGNIEFGTTLYEKYLHNINSSTVPIHSVHDFFWWLIFNMKYLNCSVRAPLYFNDTYDYGKAIDKFVNWYNAENYQLWSMNNNNNGNKIQGSVSTYKTAARKYIYEFDKNIWYKNFKLKLESLNLVVNRQEVSSVSVSNRPVSRIAFDKNYQPYSVDDESTRNYFKYHLENYKIDWRNL